MLKNTMANRLTLIALMVALAVVIARSTVIEGAREEIHLTAQVHSAPRGTGAAAGVVLDLIACLPALLALAARAARPGEVNRSSPACAIAALLAVWVGASCFWADDQFSAVVHACHLIAALSLLWAAAQCVTTPGRLRLVAAVAFGLLMLNLLQAMQWRFVDMPATLKYFEDHKPEILREHGWAAGSFMARQYETKIAHLELLGFTSSSNSLAAVLVLLGGVSAGLAIQLWRDGEKMRAAMVAMILPLTGWMLYYTQSKAAFVTPLLIALILLITWRWAPFLRRRPAAGYVIGTALLALAMAAMVLFGITNHRLPSASLNFRWRYWTASWHLFMDHPLLCVGWANFAPHYLHYRLPVAAEEIQDPHNFLVRFATETGIVGLILAAAWVARLWWELTRSPMAAADPRDAAGKNAIFAAIAGGLVLNALASIDFSQTEAFILLQVFNRLIWFAALSAGAWIVMMKPDRRPAPWILYAILASLAAFMVHNLIEFSLFEPGPQMIFALLAGSALGMRRRVATANATAAKMWPIGAALAWTAAALLVIVPIVRAEAATDAGDDQMQAGQFAAAADDYALASSLVSYNADYLFRSAMADTFGRVESMTRLDQAIARDPSAIRFRLLRAGLDVQARDAAAARADYDAALALDPNEVSIRMDYAAALMALGLPKEAVGQFQLALKFNDLLPTEEPKRIDDRLIQSEIAKALSSPPK
jgi:tetratricopeptide (TPR) repeat protein